MVLYDRSGREVCEGDAEQPVLDLCWIAMY